MKVYKITPCYQCNSHSEDSIESAVSSVQEWLKESDVGNIIKIEILEMTKKEYDALPEYLGP